MESIAYRLLPPAAGGFSDLFLDYIDAFQRVRPMFARGYREIDEFAEVIRLRGSDAADRSALLEVLREQNTAFGSPARTFEHIALLAKPTTFAVVTGQQVGLFGGPMYTVLKTVTAVKLALQLKAQFPEYDFVPVFWLEGEDHDFAEVNTTAVLDADQRVARVEYLPGGSLPERNPGPVGELVFDSSLSTAFGRLEADLVPSEFKESLLATLRGCYREGQTFLKAFAAWMNILFEDHGLVFLSPNDPRLKRQLSPLFTKEIEEFPATSQLVISRSAELEQLYHAQVKPKSLNLFLFHKGGRYLIEPRETDFSLRGTRHFLSRDELLHIARETPEQLSPNVVLRPITQDLLLPTVAYVAGPSEVAYHAQLAPVYQHFGVVAPVVYPRASASFVEDRLRRAMEKYDLQLADFFDDHARLIARVVGQISEVNVDSMFGLAAQRMQEALNELRFGIREVDPTLLAVLETVRSKTEGNLSGLKDKAHAAQAKRNEVAVRQLERAVNGLLPDGSLQERTLSIVTFMNKYGPELVRWLMSELDIASFEHQILTV